MAGLADAKQLDLVRRLPEGLDAARLDPLLAAQALGDVLARAVAASGADDEAEQLARLVHPLALATHEVARAGVAAGAQAAGQLGGNETRLSE